MRFAAISNRTVQSYFGAWRLFTVEIRAHLHLALEHRRIIVLGRAFAAWAAAAAELHVTSVENFELAEDHLFAVTAGKAMRALSLAVERGQGRRETLLKVMKSMYATERKVILRPVPCFGPGVNPEDMMCWARLSHMMIAIYIAAAVSAVTPNPQRPVISPDPTSPFRNYSLLALGPGASSCPGGSAWWGWRTLPPRAAPGASRPRC
jgi:small-conductance mechanosensitive channel